MHRLQTNEAAQPDVSEVTGIKTDWFIGNPVNPPASGKMEWIVAKFKLYKCRKISVKGSAVTAQKTATLRDFQWRRREGQRKAVKRCTWELTAVCESLQKTRRLCNVDILLYKPINSTTLLLSKSHPSLITKREMCKIWSSHWQNSRVLLQKYTMQFVVTWRASVNSTQLAYLHPIVSVHAHELAGISPHNTDV